MSYYYDVSVVVDKQTAKNLAKNNQDIFHGVTMIATNRYLFQFSIKHCTQYEEILEEVRKSSYYEIAQVGEELTDIMEEWSDGVPQFLEVRRDVFVDYDCQKCSFIEDFLNEGMNNNDLMTEHMMVKAMGGI